MSCSSRSREDKRGICGDGICAFPLPTDPRLNRDARRQCSNFQLIDISNIVRTYNAQGMLVDTLDQVPHCPPIRDLALISTEFETFTAQGDDCFRSISFYEPDITHNQLHKHFKFVSVCCYSAG